LSADKPFPRSLPTPEADRFRDLILPHMDAAYNFARVLARNPVAAEDIAQEAFLRAFRAFHTFRGGAAKAWLLAIVRNCFMDWIQAHREESRVMETRYDEPEAQAASETVDPDDPETLLQQRRDVEKVRATVLNLPEPFRETLVLRELEELSYKEIAALTEVPIGTVMSRLARARQMLGLLLLPGVASRLETQS
jgi:RNA polymerase sigma factor (sigma-70 family)